MIQLKLSILISSKETVIHIFTNSSLMNKQEVSFQSTDDILNILKKMYHTEGINGVTRWVEKSFRTDSQLSMARDVTNLTEIDEAMIYDRVIIPLNKAGEEMSEYYLKPLHEDVFDQNLFLSIRLHFIDQPFELLIYTR